MAKGLVAKSEIEINAPVEKVWDHLTDPELIGRYVLGSELVADWREGSTLRAGDGEAGKTVKIGVGRLIFFRHPEGEDALRAEPDFRLVTVELVGDGLKTSVSLTQDSNATEDERVMAERSWSAILASVKRALEND